MDSHCHVRSISGPSGEAVDSKSKAKCQSGKPVKTDKDQPKSKSAVTCHYCRLKWHIVKDCNKKKEKKQDGQQQPPPNAGMST